VSRPRERKRKRRRIEDRNPQILAYPGLALGWKVGCELGKSDGVIRAQAPVLETLRFPWYQLETFANRRNSGGGTLTIEEARRKVRELKELVECLRNEAMRHPDDREVHDDWRDSCRDLDLATAALAELLGDRHTASWFRKKARA